MKKVLVIDDHPIFRDALVNFLSDELKGVTIFGVKSLKEALDTLIRDRSFDLILLDLYLQDANGIEALVMLNKKFSKIPVMIISGNENEASIRKTLDNGAVGYIKKSYAINEIVSIVSNKLFKNINHEPEMTESLEESESIENDDIEAMFKSITSAEMRVMIQIGQGKQNKDIADELNVSIPTVKSHTSSILRKFNIPSRSQIILINNRMKNELGELYPKI